METEREARPVSSAPPSPPSAQESFLDALRAAGLMSELGDGLRRILLAGSDDAAELDAQKLDLLVTYYAGDEDPAVGARRLANDHFFLHDDGDQVSAAEIVTQLNALCPELEVLHLERIGSDDGPLVIRMGEKVAAVTDLDDPGLDTGEIDLSELDFGSVSVRGLVAAVNVLLSQRDVRTRFVPLPGDGAREAYVRVGLQEATELMRGGYLEFELPERVLEFGAW